MRMGKNGAYLLGMLITILLGTLLFVNFCDCCTGQAEKPAPIAETEPPKPNPTTFPFAVSGEGYTFEVNDNFNFNIASSKFLKPLSQNVVSGVERLKIYLDEHPDKNISIIGFYRNDETNNSPFSNLGEARANDIKNYFVSQGITSAQTNISGRLVNNMVPDSITFFGPVAYAIEIKPDNSDEELQLLHDEIVADPLIVHFATGANSIALSPEQRRKVSNISKYLDKVADAKCLIIGHTDNTGGHENNIALGKERALFVKSYFVKNGISTTKIEASSEGSKRPVATNETENGRAKNRRVEVTLN